VPPDTAPHLQPPALRAPGTMSSPTPVPSVRAWRAGLLCGLLAAAVLSACGGASSDPSSASASGPSEQSSSSTAPTFLPSSDEPPSARTIALQEEGGRLNQQELQAIAKTATLPPSTGGPSLSGAPTQKSSKAGGGSGAAAAGAVTKTAAYRFFNTRTGAHFYTTSTDERDDVLRRFPFMNLDGAAFDVSPSALTVLSPVYRFYNTRTGVHFYTISEAEKQHIIANLKSFNFEGVAYHASVLPGTGYTPLYRFFLPSRGYHFYTASQQERDHIIANLRQYTYEGIGYYVLDSQWRAPAPVPHTGVSEIHCYGDNTGDNLVDCSSDAAMRLNPQQDGHRSQINAMSYENVGTYPLSDCVRDNVTGLIWEGKPLQGPRAVGNEYTNLDNNAPNDASTYVKEVNASRLCGFDDWRLPTLNELYGIVHLGKQFPPLIDQVWFENTPSRNYWTAEKSGSGSSGIHVRFLNGFSGVISLESRALVRLVRGAPAWTGPRYLITTRNFANDAPNNAVVDRRTGLVWRRCVDNLSWNGKFCNTTAYGMPHTEMLSAMRFEHWRVPSAKEMVGLLDFSNRGGWPSSEAFLGEGNVNFLWTTTPLIAEPGLARVVSYSAASGMSTATRYTPIATFLVFQDDQFN
jgi:hypothetical protein